MTPLSIIPDTLYELIDGRRFLACRDAAGDITLVSLSDARDYVVAASATGGIATVALVERRAGSLIPSDFTLADLQEMV